MAERGAATVSMEAPRLRWVDRVGRFRSPLLLGLTILGTLPWIFYITFYTDALDAHAYFIAQPGAMYGGVWGTWDAYVYSPAFSQLIEPLRWLGWDGFRTAWRLLEVVALAVLAGPLTGPLLFVHPVSLEFNLGNIHLFMGLAVVAGFRWPWAWAFILLTKVTPGIGLLWFVVRRDWRSAAIALGATAAIAGASFALDPVSWIQWLNLLGETHVLPAGSFVMVTAPLLWRMVAAAALVVWGARTDRRWTVLVAAFLALPSIWEMSLAMLVGLIFLCAPWRSNASSEGAANPSVGTAPHPASLAAQAGPS